MRRIGGDVAAEREILEEKTPMGREDARGDGPGHARGLDRRGHGSSHSVTTGTRRSAATRDPRRRGVDLEEHGGSPARVLDEQNP